MTKSPSSFAVLLAAVCLASCAGEKQPSASESAAATALQTEEQKTIYAIGLAMGRNLTPLKLAPAELELVKRGLGDSATGAKPEVELETYGPKIQALLQARAASAAQAQKDGSKAFADAAAAESGAVKTPSGLVFRSLKAGNGPSPSASDTVRVHYEGTLTDGSVFDSSVKRGQPAEFRLDGVIPCWTEGVQRMKVGERAKLVCPSAIAYGDQGRPPQIPGGATLVFEVELLEIKK
jgi:FKBP-type peptidyl-prolyl cis-trans isomerase FkpA